MEIVKQQLVLIQWLMEIRLRWRLNFLLCFSDTLGCSWIYCDVLGLVLDGELLGGGCDVEREVDLVRE